MIFNNFSTKYHWPYDWFSKSSFIHTEFSHPPGGLGRFAKSNSIPRSQTTTFRPILIVAIRLKYLLSFVERLFQRYHLTRNDEVLKCGDSMIDLHMLSQIPLSCRCKQLLACVTAPRILTNFSPSYVKSLFCTDKTESIEWQDLVPRQLVGDCLFHIPHQGLQPSPSHQTFLHEVELRQCVFCKEPLSFWFSSRRRNSGLLGSEYKKLCFLDFVATFVRCSEYDS